MPKLSSPPAEWDSKTVVGVRERIKISGFGIKKPLNFEDQISQHKWRYLAGDTTDKTKKQALKAHTRARVKVFNVVMANRARLVDENDRTDEQNTAIQKVDHPRAYKKSRRGASSGPSVIPPPARWRSELIGEARAEKWKYAAGLNDDKSAKTIGAHDKARNLITYNTRLDEANEKYPCDRTKEDDVVIAAEVDRKAKEHLRHAIHHKACNARVDKAKDIDFCDRSLEDHAVIEADKDRKAKQAKLNKTNSVTRQKAQQDICNRFIEKHPELLVANDQPLTEQEAFDIALKLFDDKDSEYGKRLFDKLGSTLRESLYKPDPYFAIYIGAGRGFGRESYRFMVENTHCTTTTLTREDGTNFKSKDQDYKNLDLVSVEIGHFTSWSDCTAVEAAMQLILDDLEVGSQRLWLQSGVGRDRRQLRVRDAKYIEKCQAAGEDGNLTFVCFITILKNVEVLSRCTDTVTGKDVVECIKAGSGTICRVHQPRRPEPVCDPAQKAALDAARMKLGFNCIDINRKRKLDDFLSTESEDAMGEDERSENEE